MGSFLFILLAAVGIMTVACIISDLSLCLF